MKDQHSDAWIDGALVHRSNGAVSPLFYRLGQDGEHVYHSNWQLVYKEASHTQKSHVSYCYTNRLHYTSEVTPMCPCLKEGS